MKKFSMTREQVEAHQRKHGFMPTPFATESILMKPEVRDRMTKTERAYALVLEAQKRRGEIHRYQFQGITLRWGVDERTGQYMRYTPDFVVFPDEDVTIKMIEVKGSHVLYVQQAMARFKGCRADWPEFEFEMWQLRNFQWARLL